MRTGNMSDPDRDPSHHHPHHRRHHLLVIRRVEGVWIGVTGWDRSPSFPPIPSSSPSPLPLPPSPLPAVSGTRPHRGPSAHVGNNHSRDSLSSLSVHVLVRGVHSQERWGTNNDWGISGMSSDSHSIDDVNFEVRCAYRKNVLRKDT